MRILFIMCSVFINLVYSLPFFTQISSVHKRYAEICENPLNKDESSVYSIKDHRKKASLYVYKHIMKIIFSKYGMDYNEIALVEHSRGKPTTSITYSDFFKKVLSFSHTLCYYQGKGIETKSYKEIQNNGKFKLLGLYGSNSINWIVSDFASMISGVTTLVLHSKFSIDVIVDILNETKLQWLCLDLDLVEGILERKKDLPYLKKVIILDTFITSEDLNLEGDQERNISTCNQNNKKKKKKNKNNKNNKKKNKNKRNNNESFNEKENDENISLPYDKEKIDKINALKGKYRYNSINIILFNDMIKKSIRDINIKNENPDFITSIVYTSGTSGKPKGVMLSNKNFFNTLIPLCNDSILVNYSPKAHLSYLPISHVYERILVYLSFMKGIRIDIWSKDMNYFSEDIYNTKGNIIAGVPKIFSRMYTNIMSEINNLPFLKRCMVKGVLSLGKSSTYNESSSNFLDKLVGVSCKIKEKINPNLEVIINGGGKLSAQIARELSILLNVNTYQVYGLTETNGAMFVQKHNDFDNDSVGGPIAPTTKYKVRTWEIYKANDALPKGELLVKSDSVFCGYFLEKELTENAFTHDGYFKTGDIVQINPNGSLKFLDRSKELVKLSHGEYIETDKLNNLYSQISFINYCVAYGDDTMDGPLAIISIDKSLFFKSLKNNNMLGNTGVNEKNYLDKLTDDNINNNIFVDYVKAKMMEVYKETNMNRHNIINHIYLTSKVWDTYNYLTPTLKVKRFRIFKDYAFFIEKVKKIYENKLKTSSTCCNGILINGDKNVEMRKQRNDKDESSEKKLEENTNNRKFQNQIKEDPKKSTTLNHNKVNEVECNK
ncbi:acyl-CoA synthetase [Plasmodium gaboni]|uniref:Acyl-CoA synthetase n=1 Tax=Plasmodium gaboni TaxID=647221 RepID=A0A151LBM6_9APIC|nr:acyl-CoA synthetase [Plasmodium gaboni]KYN96353.1 acyl-CoA synthetase [Plasmodium gaboni]